MATIKTKVPDFTGVRATVVFANGVGHTDDPWLMEWFSKHGYEVTEDAEDMAARVHVKTIDEMSIEEMKSYLRSIGQSGKIGNYKDRDKMAAHVKAVIAEMQAKEEAGK